MIRRLTLPLVLFALTFPLGLRMFEAAADTPPPAPLTDTANAEIICHRSPRLIEHMPSTSGFVDIVSALAHRQRQIFDSLLPDSALAASESALYAPMVLSSARLLGFAPTALPTALPEPTETPAPTDTPPPTSAPPEPTEPPFTGPTYWKNAMPILRRECVQCHTAEGIAPFALETYEEAHAVAAAVKYALEERIMPPLPPDPSRALPLDDPRVMSDEDRATLIAWVEADAPEGNAADAPPPDPAAEVLPPPDITLDIGADYTPTEGLTDDYRCFDINPGFRVDTEITMMDLVQTNRRTFHHGIMYLAPPSEVAAVRGLDRADPRPGYECFGGPGFSGDEWVVAEAAEGVPRPYPDGTAKVIPAGSHFILQIHYNTLNGNGPDRTEVNIWTPNLPVRKKPVDLRLVNPVFFISPGVKEHTSTATASIVDGPLMQYRQAPPGRIHQVWGHMHYLGSGFTLDLQRADGSTQRLLDIPRWDFNWQGVYNLATPIDIEPGDTIHMACAWDNSPENQPLIGGVRQTPRLVTWGEGTLDEMCLGGVTIVPE